MSAAIDTCERRRRIAARSLRSLTLLAHKGDRIIHRAYRMTDGPPTTLMQAKVRGVRISCNLADSVGHRLFYYGEYEPMFTSQLLSELQPDDVFLDVGANCGYYSLIADRIVREVHSFEPNPALVERIRLDARANDATLTVHQVALGDSDGLMTLAAGSDGTSPEGTRYLAEGVGERVRVTRLDDYLPNVSPTIIKIDVEGYELHAVRGMIRTIERARPRVITVEAVQSHLRRFRTSPADLIEFMHGLGYVSASFEEPGYDPVLIFRPGAHSGMLSSDAP